MSSLNLISLVPSVRTQAPQLKPVKPYSTKLSFCFFLHLLTLNKARSQVFQLFSYTLIPEKRKTFGHCCDWIQVNDTFNLTSGDTRNIPSDYSFFSLQPGFCWCSNQLLVKSKIWPIRFRPYRILRPQWRPSQPLTNAGFSKNVSSQSVLSTLDPLRPSGPKAIKLTLGCIVGFKVTVTMRS